PVRGRELVHLTLSDPTLPRPRFPQPRDAAQRCGLAAPGRPEQHEELPVPHLQRQVVKGGLPVPIERFGEPPERDRRHAPLLIRTRSATAPLLAPPRRAVRPP